MRIFTCLGRTVGRLSHVDCPHTSDCQLRLQRPLVCCSVVRFALHAYNNKARIELCQEFFLIYLQFLARHAHYFIKKGEFMKLKELRIKAHLGQAELAKLLGIAQTTYSGYERGYRKPTPEMLKKLADFFGVTVDELLGRSSDPQLFDNARVERPEILDIWDKLTREQQENILNYARGMNMANELAGRSSSENKSDIA